MQGERVNVEICYTKRGSYTISAHDAARNTGNPPRAWVVGPERPVRNEQGVTAKKRHNDVYSQRG